MSDMRGVGMKYDGGKAAWNLVPFFPLDELAQVLTYGLQKYDEDSWRTVPEARKRYRAAVFRHLSAYMQGETHDQESGLHHLSHALCNIAFLMEFAKEDGEYDVLSPADMLPCYGCGKQPSFSCSRNHTTISCTNSECAVRPFVTRCGVNSRLTACRNWNERVMSCQ